MSVTADFHEIKTQDMTPDTAQQGMTPDCIKLNQNLKTLTASLNLLKAVQVYEGIRE